LELANSKLLFTRHRRVLWSSAILVVTLFASGCNDYRMHFLYPRENRGDFFEERPTFSLFVAEPQDMRPSRERNGAGVLHSIYFPGDEKMEQPMSRVVLRAMLQDLNQTRVASLVQNPENADYELRTQVLSMTTHMRRPLGAWAIPLATGVGVGLGMSMGSDGGTSDAIKTGLVGVVLGTLLPAPAPTEATVSLRLELYDREAGDVVWSTECDGVYKKSLRLSLSARKDKEIAEEFLPKALKRANACAVGQLYAFLQEHDVQVSQRVPSP
jgi:hypothetical protein